MTRSKGMLLHTFGLCFYHILGVEKWDFGDVLNIWQHRALSALSLDEYCRRVGFGTTNFRMRYVVYYHFLLYWNGDLLIVSNLPRVASSHF